MRRLTRIPNQLLEEHALVIPARLIHDLPEIPFCNGLLARGSRRKKEFHGICRIPRKVNSIQGPMQSEEKHIDRPCYFRLRAKPVEFRLPRDFPQNLFDFPALQARSRSQLLIAVITRLQRSMSEIQHADSECQGRQPRWSWLLCGSPLTAASGTLKCPARAGITLRLSQAASGRTTRWAD